MIWILAVPLAVALWWLWEIRKTLGLRARPIVRLPSTPKLRRPDFRGAIPPNRFVVVRWPDGLLFYQGAYGAEARKMYEHTHPGPGEEVEFWELGECRGHK